MNGDLRSAAVILCGGTGKRMGTNVPKQYMLLKGAPLVYYTLKAFEDPENEDLRENMSAAAHLIHGSSDGRFSITYAVRDITEEEIRGVGYRSANYEEAVKLYDPEKLSYGYNTVNGEEIFYIPNPALGLWISRERF